MPQTQEKTAASRDMQVSAMRSRIAELELLQEELKQNPPMPGKDAITKALKANTDLIPEFVKPVISVSTQSNYLLEVEGKMKEVDTLLVEIKTILTRLKKGIRIQPMGR